MAVCLVTGGAGFNRLAPWADALVARATRCDPGQLQYRRPGPTWPPSRAGAGHRGGPDPRPRDVRRGHPRGRDWCSPGALASVPRSVADPLATHEACATGTLHVLQAAREAGSGG